MDILGMPIFRIITQNAKGAVMKRVVVALAFIAALSVPVFAQEAAGIDRACPRLSNLPDLT